MNLIKARQQMGLSQEEMAKKLGVTRLTYHYWEQGKYFPTLPFINKMLTIFNKKYEDLFESTQIKEKPDYY